MPRTYTVDAYHRHAQRFGDPRTVFETAYEDLSPAKLLALGRRLVKTDPGEYREGRRTVKWPRFTWAWAERAYGDLRPGRIGDRESVQVGQIAPGRTGTTGVSEPKSPPRSPGPWIGERFGRLVVERAIKRDDGRTWLLCNCDCGGSTLAKPSHLRRGEVVSCGCKRREDSVGKLRLVAEP
jgi:hypothetical protein